MVRAGHSVAATTRSADEVTARRAADTAAVVLDALERGESGIYNIVDDEPAPVAQWLPAHASWRTGFRALGA